MDQALAELAAAVEAQPGATIVERGSKADGRYLRAEVAVDGGPFGVKQTDDVEFLIAINGQVDPPNLVDYHSVTRAGGANDPKRQNCRAGTRRRDARASRAGRRRRLAADARGCRVDIPRRRRDAAGPARRVGGDERGALLVHLGG